MTALTDALEAVTGELVQSLLDVPVPRYENVPMKIYLVIASLWLGCGSKGSTVPERTPTAVTSQKGLVTPVIAMTGLSLTKLPTGSFVDLSLSSRGFCALEESGELVCGQFGGTSDDGAPPPALPKLRTKRVRVFGDDMRGCVLDEAGTLACWGKSNRFVEKLAGRPVQQAFVTSTSACAVTRSNELVCDGSADEGAPLTARWVDSGYGAGVCALGIDRSLACWAYRNDVAPGPFRELAVAGYGECVLDDRGALTCFDTVAKPPGGDGFEHVRGGHKHFCATRGGKLVCFGPDEHGEARVPDVEVRAFDVEGARTCWLDQQGAIGCVGDGFVSVPSSGISHLEIGENGGCALTTTGAIRCFGARSGLEGETLAGSFSSVSVDKGSGCALDADGRATCWGKELANPPSEPFVQLDVGLVFACGVERVSERATCFTRSTLRSEANQASLLTPPPGKFKLVEAGVTWACGLRPDDSAECWGYKDYSDYEYTWARPPKGKRFTRLSVGYNHVCALVRESGSVTCWGRDRFGETAPRKGPFVHVSAGEVKTCAVQNDGELACWGRQDLADRLPRGPFVEVAVEKYNDESRAAMVCGVRATGELACGYY